MSESEKGEDKPTLGKRIVCWKLATFALSTSVLLLAQYLIAHSEIHKAWDILFSVLLAHSVVMLTDALCELADENAPNWSSVTMGFLLPVEPRGVSSVAMMIGLIAAIALAIQIRGCADGPPPPEPAPEVETEQEGVGLLFFSHEDVTLALSPDGFSSRPEWRPGNPPSVEKKVA